METIPHCKIKWQEQKYHLKRAPPWCNQGWQRMDFNNALCCLKIVLGLSQRYSTLTMASPNLCNINKNNGNLLAPRTSGRFYSDVTSSRSRQIFLIAFLASFESAAVFIFATCLLHWKFQTMLDFDVCFGCTLLVNNGNPIEM